MQNVLADTLSASSINARYDAQCKTVLANKEILARILKDTVQEVSQLTPEEIISCIEGTPAIGAVPVHAWRGEMITGDNTEDSHLGEGRVLYDIRFSLRVPGSDGLIKILINIEAQKDFFPGYQIVTRGIYYSARMLSSQLGTEFTEPHYDGLKKVYSIWICLDPAKKMRNSIAYYHLVKDDIVPGIPDEPSAYDKMVVVEICLSDADTGATSLLQMLNLLFSVKVEAAEKKQWLTDRFGIQMDNSFGREIELMCNLSYNIEAQGIEKGKRSMVINLLRRGKNTLQEIAEDSGLTLQEVQALQAEFAKQE